MRRQRSYDRHGLSPREERWLEQPRHRPPGKPNPSENPFGIDLFSPSMTAIELVRYYSPHQRREWWRWMALWTLQARRRNRTTISVRAEVITDPSVMDGVPVVRGTRIPAETILDCLRAGVGHREIFEDYPSLPVDGVDTVIQWAREMYGSDWRRPPAARMPHPQDR